MRANRRRDTRPERVIRSLLHRSGFRFRVDRRIALPSGNVRPDVVFGTARVAVFIDGCFWHSCPIHGELPQSNREFWRTKLTRNRERDAIQNTALEEAGWQVLRVWEHEDPEMAAESIARAVLPRLKRKSAQTDRLGR